MRKEKNEEYQYLDEITKQGMLGRKRQTKRMQCVLTLVFFLITVAILILQTVEKTKEMEQLHTFGSWKLAEYGTKEDPSVASFLDIAYEKEGQEIVVGAVLNAEQTTVCGIGTMDQELREMGNIQLLDGKWPTKEDEVAIEASVLGKLNYSYDLGQIITLSVVEQVKSTGIPLEDIEVQQQGKRLICVNINNGEEENAYQVKEESFVLTGVIKDYSTDWDNGGYWLLNGIIVCEKSSLLSQKIETQHFYTTKTSIEEIQKILTEKRYENDTEQQPSLVCNQAAYESDNAQKITNVMFLIVIFVISIYIVFQQFMVQMQKRSHYFTVLQNLGATREQLFYMIKQERQKLLLLALPIGVILAVVFSFGIVKFSSLFYQGNIVFGCDMRWLLLGILAEYVMINICFLLPLHRVLSKKKDKNRKEVSHKNLKKRTRKSNTKQSLLSISFRHAAYHKTEFLAGMGISLLICVAMFLTILIAYTQLFQGKEYEEIGQGQYVIYGKEDGSLGTPALKKMDAIDGVKYSVAENWVYGQITFEKMQESKILQDIKVKKEIYEVTYEDEESQFEDQYNTVLYRTKACEDETYYKKLASQAEESVDMERFINGETILIYIPDYISCSAELESVLQGGPTQDGQENKEILEYVKTDSKYFRQTVHRDKSLQVGDIILLKTMDGKEKQFIIGGIIRKFDPSVCWFSKPFEIVAVDQGGKMKNGVYRSCDVYTDEHATYNKTDKKMASLLQGHDWYNLRIKQETSENAGSNRMRVVLFVGMCILIFTFYVQFTNNQSQLWKEQNRIGILRTLGISSKKFYLLYVLQAIGQAILGLVFGMICFIIASFWISGNYLDASGYALETGGTAFQLFTAGVLNLKGFFGVALAGYPIGYHVIAAMLYVVLTILVYVLPVRRQLKKSITENIRQLAEE